MFNAPQNSPSPVPCDGRDVVLGPPSLRQGLGGGFRHVPRGRLDSAPGKSGVLLPRFLQSKTRPGPGYLSLQPGLTVSCLSRLFLDEAIAIGLPPRACHPAKTNWASLLSRFSFPSSSSYLPVSPNLRLNLFAWILETAFPVIPSRDPIHSF